MKGKVLIAGGSGLVGTRLAECLIEEGYDVIILSRSKQGKKGKVNYAKWNPAEQLIDEDALSANHVINLAGAGIADRPWTKNRRKELRDSRLISTNFLLKKFAEYDKKLKTYLGASAIGYYGDGGDNWQSEDQAPAYQSFMTDLCKDWEAAHHDFSTCSDRVSIVRIGIVLSTLGGAYPKMRLPFKVGVGSYFGSGDQYYSWIHIEDLAMMFIHLIETNKGHGIFNGVSPIPLTNKELIVAIKNALDISGLIISAPSITLKLTMGQMSNVILNSNRVSSKKIEQTEFNFRFGEIENAVKDIEQRSI